MFTLHIWQLFWIWKAVLEKWQTLEDQLQESIAGVNNSFNATVSSANLEKDTESAKKSGR